MDNVVTTSANPVTKPIGAETPTDALGVDPSMSTSEPESKECFECHRKWEGIPLRPEVVVDE